MGKKTFSRSRGLPLLPLALAGLMAACAGPAQWTRANTTDRERADDQLECDTQARRDTPSFGNDAQAAAYLQQQTTQCMMGKGYRMQRKDGSIVY